MKGGRTAPRNKLNPKLLCLPRGRFNEGGADCPPKRSLEAVKKKPVQASMKGGRTAPRNG